MCRVDHGYHYDLTAESIDHLLAERRAPAGAAAAQHADAPPPKEAKPRRAAPTKRKSV